MASEEFHSNVQIGSGLIVVCLKCVDCQYAKKLGPYLMLILELCEHLGGKPRLKPMILTRLPMTPNVSSKDIFPGLILLQRKLE